MSRFFKSAAFPILIVVVLAFFAQKLISPGDRQRNPNYTEFLDQVEAGKVKDVTLQTKNNRIDVELKNDKKYSDGLSGQHRAEPRQPAARRGHPDRRQGQGRHRAG